MKVVRTPLVLDSKTYSREYGIERSVGAHLMQIVELIAKSNGSSSRGGFNDEWDEQELERVRTPGFIWERVMSEHARRVDGDASLSFPGEMMYCPVCDAVMPGGNVGRDHCKSRGHRAIYFTPDAIMMPPHRRYGPLEWKWTFRSSKRTGEDHLDGCWSWPVQLMWAAKMIESDYAEIEAMFARGDYSPGKPQVLPYKFELTFDERELHRNFVMVLSTAKSEGLV